MEERREGVEEVEVERGEEKKRKNNLDCHSVRPAVHAQRGIVYIV